MKKVRLVWKFENEIFSEDTTMLEEDDTLYSLDSMSVEEVIHVPIETVATVGDLLKRSTQYIFFEDDCGLFALKTEWIQSLEFIE